MSTAALLQAACGGNSAAQGHLLHRFEPLLRSRVRRHLGPERFRAESEDLLQILRLAVLKALPGVKARSGALFAAWLNKLVRCRILDWEKGRQCRRRKPESPQVRLLTSCASEIAAAAPTPSRILMEEEQAARIRQAIEQVPEKYREVLRRILERAPEPREIAEFLGKSPEAARKFVGRALVHLREVLRAKATTVMNIK